MEKARIFKLLTSCLGVVLWINVAAQSCPGNLLTNAGGYYGGFELGPTSIAPTLGRTDLSWGSAHGNYQIVNETANLWDDIAGGGYLGLAPHSGTYFMLIHTSNERLWYKTVSVTPGETYNFCAWIASAKEEPTAGFPVQLQVKAGSTTMTLSTSTARQGTWSQVCALYTVPAGVTSVTFQIIDPNPDGRYSNFLALDDICLRTVSAGPLPVTLASFTGQKQDGNVLLSWQTAAENNTRSFAVEHSTNNSDWKTLGTVAAAGNSNQLRAYQYVHRNPAAGTNYYRLQITDANGNIALSNVVLASVSNAAYAINAVYPNPFVNDLQLSVSAASAAQVVVKIFDINGRLMQKVVQMADKGESLITVNGLQKLTKGSYLLKASVGDVLFTQKLFKQ